MRQLRYRKRSFPSVRQSFTRQDQTLKGLKRIQEAFAVRFPTGQYPSLSAVLDAVLSREAAALDSDPAYLAESIQDFERRYRRT